MPKWINHNDTSAVVLATLIGFYLADLEESEFEGEDLTALSRCQLREALDEFYEWNPHLDGAKKRIPA